MAITIQVVKPEILMVEDSMTKDTQALLLDVSIQKPLYTVEPLYINHSQEMKKCSMYAGCSMYPGSEYLEVG